MFGKPSLLCFKHIKSVVRLYFDILHGINRADIPLIVALEFAILLGFDGQLKQDSVMETELFKCVVDQMKCTKMSKTQNALIWLYVQTWGPKAQHVIDEKTLWNFSDEDLETAIMGVAYPRPKTKVENEKSSPNFSQELTSLIMKKFCDEKKSFYE